MRKKLKFIFLIWTQKKAASKIGKEETKLQQKITRCPLITSEKTSLILEAKLF